MIPEKPCRGQNKAQGFKGCGKKVASNTRRHGLCYSCWPQFLTETEAGKLMLEKATITGKKKVEKERKANRVAENKKLQENTINYKNKLQTSVQYISRLIDKDLPCLARGIFGKMAGGHVFAKGGHAQMRFNLHNIHRQCFMSNGKSADDGLMREKLEEEYGTEYLNFVKWLRRGDVPKLKDWEYREAHFNALKRIKWLEKENSTYSVKERIELRNEINLELGIYQPEFCAFDITQIYEKKRDKSA